MTLGGSVVAQANTPPPPWGSQFWGQPFDHNTIHSGNGTHTNPYTPWGGTPAFVVPAGPGGTTATFTPGPTQAFYVLGRTYSWPDKFNAVHMALIPKGPFQGHVMVWDDVPVLSNEPPSAGLPALGPGEFRSFTAYSIIDPSPNLPALQIRYRNYLLPMEFTAVPAATAGVDGVGLFCSGHVWSPFGDLIVVAGTEYTPVFKGARFTYAFNPDQSWAPYPGSAFVPYVGSGFWQRGPDLSDARWYPTATLTYPLPRLQQASPPRPAREVVLVSGGSDTDPNVAGPAPQITWNTFESLIVNGRATTLTPALEKDVINPGAGQILEYIATGPGTLLGVQVDWFEEYPRTHLLSSGQVFYSGYAPRWARWDPNTIPVSWQRQPTGPFSSNWQNPRHDGPCFLFPNIAPDEVDRVMRLGGSDNHFYFPALQGTTETVESIQAGSTPVGSWQSEPSLPVAIPPVLPGQSPTDPTLGGRYLTNAVTLPTGGIFVFGGRNRTPLSSNIVTNVFEAFLFEHGTWTSVGRNIVPSVRDYHSTGVLLPDGRVFIGGGNGRNFDYEVFSPPYRTNAKLLAQKPLNVAFTDPAPVFDTDFDAFRLPYDTAFTVSCTPLPTGVSLKGAVLMAPGSITHHSDMSARYVGMQVADHSNQKLTFQTPPDAKYAPRGIYMLFLVTNSGAVSDAIWVFLP